jgi:Concanavalin A-like lectin/glucanases superfamily
MPYLFSTGTEIGLVDTRIRTGTITLPKLSDLPGRQLILKDIYGAFATNSLTLVTQSPDLFEDGTTAKTFGDAFTFTTLFAGPTRWYILSGTSLTQATISSLYVSTLTGGIPAISTLAAFTSNTSNALAPALQSTIKGLGTYGYISSSQLISSVTGLNAYISSMIDPVELTSSIVGLGTIGFISSLGLQSTVTGLTSNTPFGSSLKVSTAAVFSKVINLLDYYTPSTNVITTSNSLLLYNNMVIAGTRTDQVQVVTFTNTSYIPFSPNSISGIQLWLDGSDPYGNGDGTVLLDGTSITAWIDKSPYGRITTLNTGTNAALLKVGIKAGLAVLRFFGASVYTTTFPSFPNSAYTIFSVQYLSTNSGSYQRLFQNDLRVLMGTNNGNVLIAQGAGISFYSTSANTPTVSNYQQWCLLTANVSGSTLSPFINGAAETTVSGITGSFSDFSIGGLPNVTQMWNGDSGEIVVYNRALSQTEQQKVEGYLAWKWGIQGSLVSGHPYNPALATAGPLS